MTLLSQNKTIQFLKKNLLLGLLIFISTLLEIYWSVGKFSTRISSGCLDCSFFQDAFFMSLITGIFLTLVFLMVSLIKNITLKSIIKVIFLILVWYFWNYTVFVDRESSWSTYTFKEELYYTLSISVFPISVLSIITVLVSNFITKSNKHK
ncbi:hypothetical protein [Flavobacterium sp. FlaQc-47]|uniref:hypothetical protein n=1 Tax=Flavobacterium sp. FlaQc-47 TaxID=3374180 RepID=UPI003756E43A